MRHSIVSNFPQVKLRYLFIAPIALFVQVTVSYLVTSVLGADLRPAGLVASYALLLAFLAINRRNPAVLIFGVGIILNLAAILANGGFMPTTPEAVMNAGLGDRIAGLAPGDVVPQTTIMLLEKSQIRLWFLSDILSLRSPFPRVFSMGDILVVLGVVLMLLGLVLSEIARRVSEPRRKRRMGLASPSSIIQPDVD
ncbi:MAG: DUF5317 domain-containing protein [Chloroflexi bacterium]|nr:DUF5317 domain-containing protein [Chloroflexota bacterium]